MAAALKDVVNTSVDPAWIGIAAELAATFPTGTAPREHLGLLFAGLYLLLGITDWVSCAAIHSRLSALGDLDHGLRLGTVHPATRHPDAEALRRAAATTSLVLEDGRLVFGRADFERRFAAARQAGSRRSGPTVGQDRCGGTDGGATGGTHATENPYSRARSLRLEGLHGADLFAAVSDHVHAFKWLLDKATPRELEDFGRRFPAFRDYATLVIATDAAVRDGAIRMPKAVTSRRIPLRLSQLVRQVGAPSIAEQ